MPMPDVGVSGWLQFHMSSVNRMNQTEHSSVAFHSIHLGSSNW